MTIDHLTAADTYFDDYTVGRQFRHARGKTVTEMDNVLLTNLVVNTAAAHFDEHSMVGHPVGQRIVFGGITASIVIGLASQDVSENAIAELGLTGMRLQAPVVHGDTLYAYTEITGVRDDQEDSGVVECHHWGVNQRGDVVFEADRSVRVRRRRASEGNQAMNEGNHQ
ncbi:MaoC family dehydratase [Nocardia rhizosphaerihabitans]|uniref:MaoC-like dehydratase n=1 Tax=Nocardia rhizosphaerihabitans TaxID=1691570 RepID=A0ABQ2KEQ0_9NOCA|nr:MaoC family dehydratase [Nocardia rhizosphaerihabitans]GGN78700.1 MaoC-like dehydratase [Nocardia rhizosphaerihabitans]